MLPHRKREIETIFEAALDRPAAERAEWVRTACGDDEVLLEGVRRLLRAHERASGVLDSPAACAAELLDIVAPAETGRRLGAYRLGREIGRGGMSIVYLAERDDRQYRQRVAVKLIRRGLDTPELVQRFYAERQILASLSHPNIARLLDGGTTQDGLPYLVMELVDGDPITDFCDRRRLTIEQRLRLFVTVTRAVQYAHRNLVVHRDLKPSNILVAEPSDPRASDGEIRLLDFGIAKLLDAEASPSAPPQTRPGTRLMTPEYASPEQLAGRPITTATDVYALGVVLYELLCGHHPFGGAQRGDQQRPRDPRAPSSLAGQARNAAAARRTQPDRLRRRLRGDLDRIVMTALRSEPERRYASVEQFAEDIERFLTKRPVRARGDSIAYRAGRFVARHRWSVAATAAIVLLLGGYAGTLTVKEREVRTALQRASLEADRAERVSEFLMRLFEAADPSEVGGDALSAAELLERGAARAERLSHDPAMQAQMLDAIGRTYRYLGRYDQAQPLLERALALRRSLFEDADPRVAESVYHLALLHHDRGLLEEAEALFRQALGAQRARHSDPVRTARTLGGLAAALRDRGAYEQAEPLAREALELRRQSLAGEHPEVADGLHDLGEILRRLGRYAEAEPLYRAALALRRQSLGERHPAVAQTMHNLAYLLQRRDDLAEVESLYRQALSIYRQRFGAEHPAVASAMSNLGLLMFRRGDLVAADSLYRRSLALRLDLLGPEHPDVALSKGLLAAVQRRKGDLDAAETLYRESLELKRRATSGEHPDVAHLMNGLALVLRDRGEYAAADSLYDEVLTLRLRLLGSRHPAVATTFNDRGVLMRRWGDYDRAEELLLHALRMRRELLGDGHVHVRRSLRNLVTLYDEAGEPDKANAYRAMLGED